MVKLSVIIPTYNRAGLLKECLEAFGRQTLGREHFELIVIDDGSTDATPELMERAAREIDVRYCRQPHAGPGAARNRGLSLARGRYVFFTGDDIIPSPNLLALHLDTLEKKPGLAVVGFTGWDPEMEITDFMRFLMDAGHQFAYGRLKAGAGASWMAFYCSNISLERRWMEGEPFDENFRYPAWDDLDLGYRLCRKGLKIVFDPRAVAFHRHAVAEEAFFTKAWQAGYSRVYFFRKYGMVAGLTLHAVKSSLILAASPVFTMVRRIPAMRRPVWEIAIRAQAARGFLAGIRERV